LATRNFTLLKQRDIEACVERARNALREWENTWRSFSGIDVDCSETFDPSLLQPGGRWTAHRFAQEPVLWCYQPVDLVKQIEHLIFHLDDALRSTDRHRESALAEGVADAAVDDLVALMLSHLAGPSTADQDSGIQPVNWQFHRNSGTAMVKVTARGKTLCILIPYEQLPSREKPGKAPVRQSLSPLPDALNGIGVRLIAELGTVEMSLGHFASLQLGDVITLPIGIDQTLTVFTEDGHSLGVAHLGKQDGNRAIEIFKALHK
jgi:flagellar motor switch/type III secretory pathway protein FliN